MKFDKNQKFINKNRQLINESLVSCAELYVIFNFYLFITRMKPQAMTR